MICKFTCKTNKKKGGMISGRESPVPSLYACGGGGGMGGGGDNFRSLYVGY